MSLPTNPLNRKEQYLNAIATGNTVDMPTKPITREEAYLDAIAKNGGGGGGGTTNYNALDNKPQIAGTTLQGNKTLNDLGIASAEALGNKVDKEAGKGLSTNDYDNTEKGKVTANAEAIEATQDMISDAYDSTHTYNVGDYCIYGNVLYKCNTAIATPEAFTPAKWDATTAAEEIKAAQSMLVTEYNGENFTAGDYCKYQNNLYRCVSPTSGAWNSSKWTEVTAMSEVERLTIGTTTQLRSGFHLQKQGNTKMLFFNGVARVGTTDTDFDDISQTGEKPQNYPIFGAGILVMDNNNFPCTMVLNTSGKIEVYYKDGTGEYKAPVNKLVYGILTWII